MLFGNPKTVHVSTRAELDAALASGKADSIVVAGDHTLLRYAEEKAGNDPGMIVRTEKETTFSVAGPTTITRDLERDADPFGEPSGLARPESPDAWVTLGAPRRGGARTGVSAPAPAPAPVTTQPAPSASTRRLSLSLIFLIACAAIAAVALWYLQGPAHGPAALPAPQTVQGTAPAPLAPDGAGSSNVPVLTWAGVAVAAILALYLIARQAIAGGQNVEISWKVTSKVEGKVIISRVQPRKQRQAKAA